MRLFGIQLTTWLVGQQHQHITLLLIKIIACLAGSLPLQDIAVHCSEIIWNTTHHVVSWLTAPTHQPTYY